MTTLTVMASTVPASTVMASTMSASAAPSVRMVAFARLGFVWTGVLFREARHHLVDAAVAVLDQFVHFAFQLLHPRLAAGGALQLRKLCLLALDSFFVVGLYLFPERGFVRFSRVAPVGGN